MFGQYRNRSHIFLWCLLAVVGLALSGCVTTAQRETSADVSSAAVDSRLEYQRLRGYTLLWAMPQLLEVARETDALLENRCDGKPHYRIADIADPVRLGTIDYPKGAIYPVSGRWQVHYWVIRCGERRMFNAIFEAKGTRPPSAKPTFPGSTIASPRLAFDTMEGVYLQAVIYAERNGCEANIKIFDTFFHDNVERDLRDPERPEFVILAQWSETWTVRVCDALVPMHVDFFSTNLRPGTTFKVAESDANVNAFLHRKVFKTYRKKGDPLLYTVIAKHRPISQREVLPFIDAQYSPPGGLSESQVNEMEVLAQDNIPLAQIAIAGLFFRGAYGQENNWLRGAYWLQRALETEPGSYVPLMCKILSDKAPMGAVFGKRAERWCKT